LGSSGGDLGDNRAVVRGAVLQHPRGRVREATRVHVVQACRVGPASVGFVMPVAELDVTVAESVSSIVPSAATIAKLDGTVAESVSSVVPSAASIAKLATSVTALVTSLAGSVTSAAGIVTSVAGSATSLAESNPVEAVGVPRRRGAVGFKARCFAGLQKHC
jgi:hypothetical protein